MVGLVLEVCGLLAVVIGGWRSYAAVRDAIAPLVQEGDPTRTAIEATRPLPFRPRVRAFARRLAVAIAWLLVVLYGLYLVVRGQAVPG